MTFTLEEVTECLKHPNEPEKLMAVAEYVKNLVSLINDHEARIAALEGQKIFS